MSYVLHLDDDPEMLSFISGLLSGWGYESASCLTVDEAKRCLQKKPAFAIVDVYLKGASGKELSTQFVTEELQPRNIPYGRLTSAPESVDAICAGQWTLHKYDVRQNPDILGDALLGEL